MLHSFTSDSSPRSVDDESSTEYQMHGPHESQPARANLLARPLLALLLFVLLEAAFALALVNAEWEAARVCALDGAALPVWSRGFALCADVAPPAWEGGACERGEPGAAHRREEGRRLERRHRAAVERVEADLAR